MVKYLLLLAIVAYVFILTSATGRYRRKYEVGQNQRHFSTSRRSPRNFHCNKNEIWSTCPPAACRPKTCDEVGFPLDCEDLPPNGQCSSNPGCICRENYVRDHRGVCIPIEFCPTCGGDPNAEPGCGNCNPLCSNYGQNDIVCTQECRFNACDCKEGFVFDEINKKCVTPSQCPSRKRCKKNEVYDFCPSSCPFRTCGINDAAVSCAPSLPLGHPDCPPPTCRCKDGFYRNHRGNCVPWKYCPKCKRPNEVYDPCPISCPPRRCDVNPALILCEIQPQLGDPKCKPSCRCADGFLRNGTGICIPQNDCPSKCDVNEVYTDCIPNDCKPESCSQLGLKIECPIRPAVCKQGCICEDGHVRNDEGKCIPIEQCPTKCDVNEVYTDCIPNDCKPESCSQLGIQIECPIRPAVCKQGCICKDGHVRNEQGICIPIEQCPSKCAVNEMYTDCIPNDCKPESCSQLGLKIECPIRPAVCKQGCICKDGHVRNEEGICIPIEQCGSCGGDSRKKPGCGVYCNQRCSDIGKEPGACIAVCNENACDCRDGFFLDENTGQCVPPEQCSTSSSRTYSTTQQCPAYEEFSDCIQNDAIPQNCSQLGFPIDYTEVDAAYCKEGCICIEGYLRDDKGNCIPEQECSSCGGDSGKVPGCGVYCNQRCSDIGKEPGACIDICYENACDCRDGYYLNEKTGQCVPPEQCALQVPQCPVNEEFSDCIQNKRVQSCSQLGFPINSTEVEAAYCKQGCVCKEGYVRDYNGYCIPVGNCPSCGGDSGKVPGCGVYCNQRCSDIGKEPGACIDICYENDCNCRDGYYLNEKTGQCVPPEQCAPQIPQCPVNEEFSDCIQNKRVQSCSQLGLPINSTEVEAAYCKQGCICKEGYARDYNGYCVPIGQCPACAGDINKISGCGVYCNQRCSDIGIEPNFCIQVCYENACNCRNGFYLDESTGQCVLPQQCTPQCPTNEIYSECIQGDCSPKNCSQVGLPIACPRINPEFCQKGCICKEGYARNNEGYCVPINECAPQCPENEVYSECTQANCSPEYCSQIGYPQACPRVIQKYCKKGCLCKQGYARNDKGICIPSNECPSCRGDINARPGCGGYCNNRCSNIGKEPQACTLICEINGCDCKPGYYFDDKTEQCVKPEQCSLSLPSCGQNEEYSNCTNANFGPKTCNELGYPLSYNDVQPENCIKGCRCIAGHVRNDKGICIPSESCPSCGGDPNAKPGCGGNCNKHCSNIGKEPGACALSCRLNGCDCKDGYYFDDNLKKCVRPEQCVLQCPTNERFETCPGALVDAQYCNQLGYRLPYSDQNGNATCSTKPGCVCVDGYVRDANGRCIPKNECPSCGGDIYSRPGCGVNCGKRCRDLGSGVRPCIRICYVNACDCIDGYYYDDIQKKCVLPGQCTDICDKNEVFEDCSNPTCKPETCSEVGLPLDCKKPCRKGCVCQYGYVRDENGSCVPANQCPSCGGDENSHLGCGTNCGKRCPNNYINPKFCPRIACTPQLNKCDCNDGFFFDANTKKCVKLEDCSPRCNETNYEEYNSCINGGCGRQNCSQVGEPMLCSDPIKCNAGCKCKEGYLRLDDGTCVPESQCPASSCGGDENAQRGCGFNCGKRCPNNYINPNFCPRIQCQPDKCDCKDGFFFDINTKRCVKYEDCSPRCNENNNEVYDSCVDGGCGWKNCSQVGGPVICVKPLKCYQGCKCKEGYYRRDDGTCVPENQCPKKKCTGPNEYFDCGPECDNVCGKKDNKYNCPIVNIQCNTKCYCRDGFARNKYGICVPSSQCPRDYFTPNQNYDYRTNAFARSGASSSVRN